jgi:hypothetical protein
LLLPLLAALLSLAPLHSPDLRPLPHWFDQSCPTGSHISNQLLTRGLLITLMMDAASTSETSVNFHQTTRRNNSAKDSPFQRNILLPSAMMTE